MAFTNFEYRQVGTIGQTWMHKVIAPHTHRLKQIFRQVDESVNESIGCYILAILAADVPSLPGEFFEPRPTIIEAHSYTSKDWLEAEMNNTLIAISSQSSILHERTFTAAVWTGTLIVDHRDPVCPHSQQRFDQFEHAHRTQ